MADDTLKISVHHVGGRAGSRAFPVLPHFEADVVNCLYDADPSCVEQIREANAGLASELHVLPYLLWSEPGHDLTLHVTYDPYASSVFELNPDYRSWHYPFPGARYDYPFDPALRGVERVKMRSQSLDAIYGEAGQPGTPPPPDFLSLDTQGAEYEILQGARRVLHEHVLAVASEVEFHELYLGQRLFDDIFRSLRAAGFHFVDVDLAGCSPYRAPMELRAEHFKIMGDALFLRNINALAPPPGTPAWSCQASKLAFLALVFHRVEYAIMILERLREVDGGAPGSPFAATRLGTTTYLRFLEEFHAAALRSESRPRRTFAEVYSFAASKARFAPGRRAGEPGSVVRLGREVVRRVPGARPFALAALRRAGEVRRALDQRRRQLGWYAAAMRAGEPDVERVLRRHGMNDLARKLRASRRARALHGEA